nr:hypothetical protein [Candidatus Cloacimonadota bacterium]
MKRRLIIVAFCISILSLGATNVSFSPQEIQLNRLSTLSFDPIRPESQPILTNATVTNGSEAQRIKMQVVLKWNNQTIIGPQELVSISKEVLSPHQSVILSNRDLITEHENIYFEPDGYTEIDIMDSIENYPTLEEAAISGYFPDGVLELELSVKGENSPNWESTGSFRIRIRNAGSIQLISPGRPIGQTPPNVSALPLSFFWNAVNTGFNDEQLVIREFAPYLPPQLSTVERSGTEVYHSETGVMSGFSDYIPFNDGYYYAWQVYVPLYDENNPLNQRSSAGNSLKSRWFVFRFVEDMPSDRDGSDIQALLNQLENEDLLNLQNLGFTPTGEVIFEGKVYRGQDAIDLISNLLGKEIEVRIMD